MRSGRSHSQEPLRQPRSQEPLRQPRSQGPLRQPRSQEPLRQPRSQGPLRRPRSQGPLRQPRSQVLTDGTHNRLSKYHSIIPICSIISVFKQQWLIIIKITIT
ncbi:MAG: hypothetical protein ABIG42_07795, partial [bacterium]